MHCLAEWPFGTTDGLINRHSAPGDVNRYDCDGKTSGIAVLCRILECWCARDLLRQLGTGLLIVGPEMSTYRSDGYYQSAAAAAAAAEGVDIVLEDWI